MWGRLNKDSTAERLRDSSGNTFLRHEKKIAANSPNKSLAKILPPTAPKKLSDLITKHNALCYTLQPSF
jgi:hypothetical protein